MNPNMNLNRTEEALNRLTEFNNNCGATSQDTLQALLNLLNNSNSTNSQKDDKTLFLLAKWHVYQKPITSTAILQKDKSGQVQNNFSGLVETEEVESKPNYEEQLDPESSKKSGQK
ncbi:11727_t:CDS:2, partial [Gigaspora margarita]